MTDGVPRRREPAAIGDLIDDVLGRIARSDVAPVVRLRRQWEQVAGEWAERCRPVGISGDVLTVEVSSGMEASMLRYEAETLLGGVRETLGGKPVVSRLSIKVAGARNSKE